MPRQIVPRRFARGIDGLIISNTTTARPQVVTDRRRDDGWIERCPLVLAVDRAARSLPSPDRGRLPLVGVGGILRGGDAYAKIRAGAIALQLYTALVYRGPRVVSRILAELDQLLALDGVARLEDARGADVET